jgi:uncharacterized protein YqcC (DUF446 family)
MTLSDFQQSVSDLLDEIEREMRTCGLWQSRPLEPEQMHFTQAFGMDTMSFDQWLQFIFIPRVREAVVKNSFPASSQVGAQAVREFDTVPAASGLVTLLSRFDALFRNRS